MKTRKEYNAEHYARTKDTEEHKKKNREDSAKYRAAHKNDPVFLEKKRLANHKHFQKTKEKTKVQRAKWRRDQNLRQYGLTVESYARLLEEQEHRCKVCGSHESEVDRGLYVDHCHTTSKVRGLLCNKCNFALGHVNDSVELLEGLIKYLKS